MLSLSAVDFTQSYPIKMTPQKRNLLSANVQLQFALVVACDPAATVRYLAYLLPASILPPEISQGQ
jgi:hypothetical protein